MFKSQPKDERTTKVLAARRPYFIQLQENVRRYTNPDRTILERSNNAHRLDKRAGLQVTTHGSDKLHTQQNRSHTTPDCEPGKVLAQSGVFLFLKR